MRKYIITLLIKRAAQKHCTVPSTGYKIGDTRIIPNKFFPRHLRKLSEYFRTRTHSIATGAKEFCILKDCTICKVSANCTFEQRCITSFFSCHALSPSRFLKRPFAQSLKKAQGFRLVLSGPTLCQSFSSYCTVDLLYIQCTVDLLYSVQ